MKTDLNRFDLLYVNEQFYPSNIVGAVRAVKMAKYLRRLNQRVMVVAFHESFFSTLDRTRDSEVDRDILRLPRGIFKLLPRHLAFTLNLLTFLAFQRPKKKPPILLSGPPFLHFALTPIITRLLGYPVILDYRDEWQVIRRKKHGAKFSTKLLSWIEKRALRSARRVTFANASTERQYKEALPSLTTEVVENGFDEEDLPTQRPSSPRQRVILSGKLFYYDPEIGNELLKAIEALTRAEDKIEFLLLTRESAFVEFSQRMNSEKIRTDWLPYQEALTEIAASKVCLCLTPDPDLSVGTKVYDYLALQKPVLFLNPNWGALKDTGLRDHPLIHCIESRTAESIEKGIRHLLTRPESSEGELDHRVPTRRKSAQKLAQLLKTI